MSDRVKYHDRFFEIDGRVRIEAGKAVKRDVMAGEELLKKIHPYYSTPHRAFNNHPIHGKTFAGCAMDQGGQPIRLGAPMAYIDYFSPDVWFVYRLEDDETHNEYTKDEDGNMIPHVENPMHHKRWIEHGQFATREEAETFAAGLLNP